MSTPDHVPQRVKNPNLPAADWGKLRRRIGLKLVCSIKVTAICRNVDWATGGFVASQVAETFPDVDVEVIDGKLRSELFDEIKGD